MGRTNPVSLPRIAERRLFIEHRRAPFILTPCTNDFHEKAFVGWGIVSEYADSAILGPFTYLRLTIRFV